MRLPALCTVYRVEPYVRPPSTAHADILLGAPLSQRAQQAKQLLETAVAAWPDVLTVPPPGSDAPAPPTWAAWGWLFGALVQNVAQAPNIIGFDVWLADVQRAQLARRYVPPVDKRPVGVLACRMGAEVGSPRTFNVVRRLLELREALWCAAQLPDDVTVDVGCDQKKWRLGATCIAPSSDLAISAPDGKILRRIEVTSLHKAVQGPDSLHRCFAHIVRKAQAEQDGAANEGCVAVHWAPGVVARDCLEEIAIRLNDPVGYAPVWQQVATTLQSVSFVDYSPTLAPRVWGRLSHYPNGWRVEPEVRLLLHTATRRMSTGQLLRQSAQF